MAIIPSIPGVQAEVKVDGERVEEYSDSSQCCEGNTTVKYIEAVSDARFTLHCKVWHPYDIQGRDIQATFRVDGKIIQTSIITYGTYKGKRGEMDAKGATSLKNGIAKVAPMAFSELDIDENSEAILNHKLYKQVTSVGEIRIQIDGGKATSLVTRNDSGITMDEIGKISEKALKGKTLSHQAKLRESMPYGHCIVYDDFVAEEDIATFVFRYRSKSALQAEGIIPRTPSPTPLEERPLEELNQEELRELLRRHRASPPFERDAAASVVKREFKAEEIGDNSRTDVDNSESDLEVTTVRPVKRQRISGPDEAIDLTGD